MNSYVIRDLSWIHAPFFPLVNIFKEKNGRNSNMKHSQFTSGKKKTTQNKKIKQTNKTQKLQF